MEKKHFCRRFLLIYIPDHVSVLANSILLKSELHEGHEESTKSTKFHSQKVFFVTFVPSSCSSWRAFDLPESTFDLSTNCGFRHEGKACN